MDDYYVYVYIDPRNFEEFYFGKGSGNRKNAHLSDNSDSKKTRRIAEIKKEGLEPIIRVIAANLNERDALLVEKTLLWKLGRTLTNKSSGHYANKFRPKNTLHKLLHNFDYEAGIYYFNVGEGKNQDWNRNWDDMRKYGFISAGGGLRWKKQILSLQKNDIIAAFLPDYGYVGIGRILSKATMVTKALDASGRSISSLKLIQPNMFANAHSEVKSEYTAPVHWFRSVAREEAKWVKRSGLYSSQLVRASLQKQNKTLAFLNSEFKIDIEALLVEELF